ncbi:unnamed protein product, partial [Scytosiphon promiscuus]
MPAATSSLDELQRLSLVSKVCTELDNHLGLSDRTLAEFIIHLADEFPEPSAFRHALSENGADFPDSLNEKEARFPGLAMPNTNVVELEDGFQEVDPARQEEERRKKEEKKEQELKAAAAAVASAKREKEARAAAATVVEERREGKGRGGGRDDDEQQPRKRHRYARSLARSRSGERGRERSSRWGDADENDRGDGGSRRRRRDDDRSRDRSRDRSGERSGRRRRGDGDRSGSRDRGRDRRDRDGSRDRDDRRRRGGGDYDEDGAGELSHPTLAAKQDAQPELYGIYDGSVSKLRGFPPLPNGKRQEGLVHVSQIQNGMLRDPSKVVKRGQNCKVKVISSAGARLSLSIKEVDQSTGEDLMPGRGHEAAAKLADELKSNPSGPAGGGAAAGKAASNPLHPGLTQERLRAMEAEEEKKSQRAGKHLSEQEMWEARQLIASGVLPVSEYPTFDPDSGMGILGNIEETEEELEIELNEDEPAFLRGQTRQSRELSPVRIVANPDGSMQRSALQQVQMAKERRELRQAQANQAS